MAKPKKKPGPKPVPDRARSATTMVRSGEPWKEWLERLAAFDGAARRADPNLSDTIDRAVVSYAREIGFKEAAPPR